MVHVDLGVQGVKKVMYTDITARPLRWQVAYTNVVM